MNFQCHSSSLDTAVFLRYQSCECPHRLSDKLLKSVANRLITAACEVAYTTRFTASESITFFDFLQHNDKLIICTCHRHWDPFRFRFRCQWRRSIAIYHRHARAIYEFCFNCWVFVRSGFGKHKIATVSQLTFINSIKACYDENNCELTLSHWASNEPIFLSGLVIHALTTPGQARG